MFNNFSLLKKSLCFSAACAISCGAVASIKPKDEKLGILLVAFGTSQPGAKKAYDNINKIIAKKFTKTPLRWAYTSQFIRKKLAKQGVKTYSVTEALENMKKENFTKIAVQSLHIANGSEYEEVLAAVERFQSSPRAFKKITIGLPLLISANDLNKFGKAIVETIPAERTDKEGIVLMGHGNHHGTGDTTFIATESVLNSLDPNIFLGTVEGKPNFDDMNKKLKKAKVKKVYLMPMMVVAGDHAVNDLAGDEDDSWKILLKKQGITSIPVLKGLGEYDSIVAIFANHLQTALNNLDDIKKK